MKANVDIRAGADLAGAGLLGVVLCGGESRRMGRDKGLMERDGNCWAARIGEMLANCGLPVVYSIRVEQEKAYLAALGEVTLVVDTVEIGGPLNGLLSVHRRFPLADLLVIACDMQEMDEETIGALIGVYQEGGSAFYVYYEGEFAQPFCAVYTAGGLVRVTGKMGEERRLRAFIGMGEVRRLEVRRREVFENYNSI